jgi:hypothetical protein
MLSTFPVARKADTRFVAAAHQYTEKWFAISPCKTSRVKYVKKLQIPRSLTIEKFPISTLKRQFSGVGKYREKAETRKSNFCSSLRKIGLVGQHRSKCSHSRSACLVSSRVIGNLIISSRLIKVVHFQSVLDLVSSFRNMVKNFRRRWEKKIDGRQREPRKPFTSLQCTGRPGPRPTLQKRRNFPRSQGGWVLSKIHPR